MKKIIFSLIVFSAFTSNSWSQCAGGEVEVTMNIYVDSWGEETYWEFVPSGNECGDGTVAFGSNAEEVGCFNSIPITGNYGYPDNTMIEVGPWCLTIGDSFDMYFVDSYGDGGLVFEIFYDGALAEVFYGSGSGNMWTFTAGISDLPEADQPCQGPQVLVDGPSVSISNVGAIASFGEIHPPDAGCSLYGAWCESGVSNSVWAWFVVPDGGTYEVSTCNAGTTFDTQIAVWSGNDCAQLQTFELISSQDDAGCGEGAYFASTCFVSCLDPTAIYYVQIDGWAGETGMSEITITSSDAEENLQAFVNNVSCPLDKGANGNGSIQSYIDGSGSNFTSEWTGPDGFSANTNWIYNLNAGQYSVIVESACGTIFEETYTISAPSGWNVNYNVSPPECPNSEDGSIEVIAAGATAPYTFGWIGPDGFSAEGPVVDDLAAGNYSLFISDDRGCEYDQTITLEPAGDFSFDLGNDTVLCIGETYLLTAPVGLSYLWQDGSENQFYNIYADEWGVGQHVVILTAETPEGCTYTDAFIFSVEICNSIDDVSFGSALLYPNPTSGIMNIDNSSGRYSSFYITDMSGRVVARETKLQTGIRLVDLNLAGGQYILHMEIGNSEETFKFTLIK